MGTGSFVTGASDWSQLRLTTADIWTSYNHYVSVLKPRAASLGCLWFYKHPPFTKVKPGRAGLVLGWVTAWEYPVSRAPFYERSPPKIEVVYPHSLSANNIHLLHRNSPRVHQVSTSQHNVGQICIQLLTLGHNVRQHERKFKLESAPPTLHRVRMVGICSTPMWTGLDDMGRAIPFWRP